MCTSVINRKNFARCTPSTASTGAARNRAMTDRGRGSNDDEIPRFTRNGNKCQKVLVFVLGKEALTSENRRWD